MVKFKRSHWLQFVIVFQVLKEKKIFAWVFMVQNLPEVAFFVYVIYLVS